MLRKATLTIALVLTASTAWGQYWVNGYNSGPSTAAQSYATGYADVVRAAGEAEVNDSIAAGNYADARSKEIDNRLKATQTYFQMKDINKKWQEANKIPPLTQEEAYRWAKAMSPKRTTSTQLDPVTGKIIWPIILRDTPYKDATDQLDAIFSARVTQGALNGSQYAQVQKLHDDILSTMTANAKNYKDVDIIAAKNLIDSLQYEARFPAG